MTTVRTLLEHEAVLIDFERNAFMLDGSKESNIRLDLRMSPTKYYRLLNSLIDDPAAYAYDPLTVTRLRRQRDERRRTRIEGPRVDRGRR
jgi:hypothetical protein